MRSAMVARKAAGWPLWYWLFNGSAASCYSTLSAASGAFLTNLSAPGDPYGPGAAPWRQQPAEWLVTARTRDCPANPSK
eukprot:3784568-Prymnesium_polylepis.1